jgi:hypothetical protein
MRTRTRKLERREWAPYFNELSKRLALTSVSILVEGLDLGVQPEASHIELSGITYDHADDAVEVLAKGLAHRIPRPTEIYVQEDARGHLVSCRITDADGHEQILELEPSLLVAS